MRLNMFLRILLLVGGLGLLATACGDDGDSSSPATTDDGQTDDGSGDGAADDTTDDGADDSTDSGADDGGDPGDRGPELTGTWSITTFQLAGAEGEAMKQMQE